MKALNYEINPKELSPQLQVLIQLELRQNTLEKAFYEKPVQMKMSFEDADPTLNKKQTVLPSSFVSTNDWRRDTNAVICAVERDRKNYSTLRGNIYRELEARMKCSLERRLSNLRKNMIYNGATRSEANKKNYLDVIEKDSRLIACFISVVKEVALANNIKYNKQYKEVVTI